MSYLFYSINYETKYLHFFIDKMFPVQVLVVLSAMIIINHAATLNYENRKSATTNNEVFKMIKKMINDKIYDNLKDNNSDIAASYDFNTTDSYGNIIDSDEDETALPVLKSMPWLLIGEIIGNTLFNFIKKS